MTRILQRSVSLGLQRNKYPRNRGLSPIIPSKDGRIRYELRTPYRDGTTHVIFEPLDFLARLAALVPKPRVNLARFHGVFAPNSNYRIQVTPSKRDKGRKRSTEAEKQGVSSRIVTSTSIN